MWGSSHLPLPAPQDRVLAVAASRIEVPVEDFAASLQGAGPLPSLYADGASNLQHSFGFLSGHLPEAPKVRGARAAPAAALDGAPLELRPSGAQVAPERRPSGALERRLSGAPAALWTRLTSDARTVSERLPATLSCGARAAPEVRLRAALPSGGPERRS